MMLANRTGISSPISRLAGGTPPNSIGKSVGLAPVLGSFEKGGKVPKDGAYQLEEGERVIPAEQPEKRNSEYRRVFLKRKKG